MNNEYLVYLESDPKQCDILRAQSHREAMNKYRNSYDTQGNEVVIVVQMNNSEYLKFYIHDNPNKHPDIVV